MNIDLEIGDLILCGKFQNKKVVIKSIETNEIGQPTYNGGKPILKFRIQKLMPKKIIKENEEKIEGGNYSFKNQFGSFTSIKVIVTNNKKEFLVQTTVRMATKDSKGNNIDKLKKIEKWIPMENYKAFKEDLLKRGAKPLKESININKLIEAIESKTGKKVVLNENISKDDLEKVKEIIKNNTFLNFRKPLIAAGFKVYFTTEPVPYYTAEKYGKKLLICNKKYAENPEFVHNETAMGLMESELISSNKKVIKENFSLKDLENYYYDNEKDIKDNMKTYGYKSKDIKKITNYYDLANVLGNDSRDLKNVELKTYVETLYDLLEG